ncbi:MAG: IclR family transcriptional regulator [Kineosporiaceae bacterium]|jgi:IclR family acetate operon transcriptional repressor
MPTAPAGSQAGSQAVDRAAALLALVVESGEPRTFTSLVEAAGLAKSTTSRLLHALERGRLVQRDRSGSFRPGPVFAVYAARQQTMHDLVALLRPAMDRLAASTGETVTFAVPRGDGVVQVAQADGRYLLGTTNWVGVDVPPHCSAQGKVFYAFGRLQLPVHPALPRRTPSTVATLAQLERDLLDVRRRGWAVANEELEIGLVAVAAPVRATDGLVLGALSVSGPTARIPAGRLAAVGEALVTEARKVSALLGYHHSGKEGAA